MADAVTSQTLLSNEKRLIMKFTNVSDGTGESAVAKVDVSTLDANRNGDAVDTVQIDRVWYTTNGMSVRVLLDATADELVFELPADSEGSMDFSSFGLQNSKPTGYTGDILFTTIGHGSGDSYTVILDMTKHYE